MYVGKRHSATVTLSEVRDFTCTKCTYKTQALVSASGRGHGNSPFFLDDSGASERAMSSAEKDARENLAETLRLATCPTCHRRNEAAVRILQLKVAFLALLVFAAVVGIMWLADFVLIDARSRSPFGPWLRVPVGCGCALVVFWTSRRKWRTADDRVQFGVVQERPERKPPRSEAPRRVTNLAETDPFRSPPSTPIAVIQTAAPPEPTPIVPGDPNHQPTLLT